MHRFHSRSTILRFRFAALLLFLKFLLPVMALGVLGYGWANDDHELMIIGLGLGLLAVLVSVLQWLLAWRTRCPLCMTPLMVSKGCSKHRNARTVLGSHQLRVAMAIMFKDSFVCPYCHEASAMEVRHRPGYRQNHRD